MTSPLPRFDGTEACWHPTADEAAGFDAVPAADTAPAKAVCADCRFVTACQTYALSADVEGVWGGTDGEDRRRLRSERNLPEPRRISDDLDDLVHRWRTGRPVAGAAALSAA